MLKTMVRLGGVTVAALALVACSTPGRVAWQSQVDEQHVAAVNNAAARAGVRVIWVNPPTRPVSGANASRRGGG